ncbi:hypothetical protein [Paenibacillus ehimensis]|uniref:Uncharacterized protein n=1 Tax=Paenibacillus ehimensis TaxID=79264 RepID=A0ABT8VMG0_9BACL|nr:hypothetical protein [Paenibacillus ehimensis]MDO3682162.1 hypothetical protein [Paenibacillus ehimensis]
MNRAQVRAWRGMTAVQKSRVGDALLNATIRDGAIIAPDGYDVSHRLKLEIRTTEAQRKHAKDRSTMGLFADENGGFVFSLFISCSTVAERFPTLTQSDMARLMFIGTYTGYEDGRLRYDNGTPLLRTSLEKLVGLSRARFSEFYNRLVTEDILREEDGEIDINPTVFQRGGSEVAGTEDYQRTRLYRRTVRDLYEAYGKGRDVKQLAIVYAVIPFLHFNTNIVCYNPQEYNAEKLKPMTLDKLAALLHYSDTQKLKIAMSSVMLGGRPVFGFVEDVNDKRKRRVIVNPRVVFAGNADGLRQVRGICALFN